MGADLVANIIEIEKGKTPNWAAAERHVANVAPAERTRLRRALRSVIECWDGASRNAIRYDASATTLLIVGGTTVGDPFDEIDDVEAFVTSGMARAAGFIVRDDE